MRAGVKAILRYLGRDGVLTALGLLSVLGLGAVVLLREISFPVASIEFRLLPSDAVQVASRFLQEQGQTTAGYQVAVSFETDDDAKGYLERRLGANGMSHLAREDVSIWHWKVRFFRPLQQEESIVLIDPNGRLVGYSHVIPEAEPGASLSAEKAQGLAEAFLASGPALDLSAYHLVVASQVQRPSRLDHVFVWERNGFRVGEATYRVQATVHGNRVDGFREYVKTPEAWVRSQAGESDRGWVLVRFGWAASYGLALAMATVFLLGLREGRIRCRVAAAPLGLLAVIGAASVLNSIPLFMASYPTTADLPTYLVERVVSELTSLAPLAALASLAALSGAWLRARLGGDPTSLARLFSRGGFACVEVVRAVAVGYIMAGVWLGYVVVFYWLGLTYWGVWSPAELPYQDIMSTVLPAVYPLTVGAGAAITEEFVYRLFAVPLLLLLLGRLGARAGASFFSGKGLGLATAAAIVLPALVWGSLHSTYPQQPFYIRAVEVSLVGIGSGVIFLRYGILATIVSHYVYNASVVGGLFLLSPSLYLQASAVVVVLLPLLLLAPAIGRWRAGQPLGRLEDLPDQATPVLRSAQTNACMSPLAVTRGRDPALWQLALLTAASGAALLFWLRLPSLQPGNGLGLTISRQDAMDKAAIYLSRLGMSSSNWWKTAWFADWALGNDAAYLYRALGLAKGQHIIGAELRSYPFTVRYFRPGEREELQIRLDPQGGWHSFVHVLDEQAPGANLALDEARRLAEDFLLEQGIADVGGYRLVTSSSEKRDSRTDHYLVWEREDNRIGEGAFRLQVTVQGDQIGAFQGFLKTPESFDRQLEHKAPLHSIAEGMSGLVQTAAWGGLIVVFALRFRDDQLRWRWAFAGGALLAGVRLALQANQLPALMADYRTVSGFEVFVLNRTANTLMRLSLWFAEGALLVGLTESLHRERFGPARDQTVGRAVTTALIGLSLIPFGLAGSRLYWVLVDLFDRQALVPGPSVFTDLVNAWWPALQAVLVAVEATASQGLLALSAGLLLWRMLGSGRLAVLASWLALTAVQAAAARGFAGTVIIAALCLGAVIAAVAVWRTFLRYSAWGFVTAVFSFLVVQQALFLLAQPSRTYADHGWLALVAALGAPIVMAVACAALRQRDRSQDRQQSASL